jgi:alkanesulfonate monooxygenase SsuD/methylene tetrahydromethanopterin reductase-like flavin-dependent oxidoreductase (luciferase family)
VDETEELAEATAEKLLQGPSNPFLEGNQGSVRPWLQSLPGLSSRANMLPTVSARANLAGRGLSTTGFEPGSFKDQRAKRGIIAGTPKSVLQQLRAALENVRPGIIMIWDGDGAMTHDDTMRSLRLMGSEVLPALREYAKELDLPGPFEVDPATGARIAEADAAG